MMGIGFMELLILLAMSVVGLIVVAAVVVGIIALTKNKRDDG
jgi:hypothetical protein